MEDLGHEFSSARSAVSSLGSTCSSSEGRVREARQEAESDLRSSAGVAAAVSPGAVSAASAARALQTDLERALEAGRKLCTNLERLFAELAGLLVGLEEVQHEGRLTEEALNAAWAGTQGAANALSTSLTSWDASHADLQERVMQANETMDSLSIHFRDLGEARDATYGAIQALARSDYDAVAHAHDSRHLEAIFAASDKRMAKLKLLGNKNLGKLQEFVLDIDLSLLEEEEREFLSRRVSEAVLEAEERRKEAMQAPARETAQET